MKIPSYVIVIIMIILFGLLAVANHFGPGVIMGTDKE